MTTEKHLKHTPQHMQNQFCENMQTVIQNEKMHSQKYLKKLSNKRCFQLVLLYNTVKYLCAYMWAYI